jgi:hypothetical protein
MNKQTTPQPIHPKGENVFEVNTPITVESFGGRIHVEWDSEAELTPMGQLSFFADFLKTAQLYDSWIEDCPLRYTSPNAPSKRDVLGTLLLSILAGHKRYAHITSIRCDQVNPALLGMKRVMSEDAVRRAFQKAEAETCAEWQRHHLRRCWEPLLYEPWILDIDSTVKPLYGKQEGAEVGFNPHKPGRPSHVYHTYLMANLRLVLDVEVQPGNQGASSFMRPQLFAWLDALPAKAHPAFLRGDSGFGNEGTMAEAEERHLDYLFKLRQTKTVKALIEGLPYQTAWQDAGQGWEGTEVTLHLQGWSRKRRGIVLRREVKGQIVLEERSPGGQQMLSFVEPNVPLKQYEYAVLVTSLPDEIFTLVQHYRDRADSENAFDELKNQWSWGGFTTHDLHRCQIMARHTALIYNWWSLYVRGLIPERHAEAITSRPLLLYSIGKQIHHAGQTVLKLTCLHAHWKFIQDRLRELTAWLNQLRQTAEQLDWNTRWRIILSRIFAHSLKEKLLAAP